MNKQTTEPNSSQMLLNALAARATRAARALRGLRASLPSLRRALPPAAIAGGTARGEAVRGGATRAAVPLMRRFTSAVVPLAVLSVVVLIQALSATEARAHHDGSTHPDSVVITGTPTQGETLELDISRVNRVGVTDTQWRRNGATITGASGLRYTLTEADVGRNISARLRYRSPTSPAPRFLTSTAVGPVADDNVAPTISGTPVTLVSVADGTYSFTPTGEDRDGDTLTYSISTTPGWANFSTTTGALTGTLTNADAGTTTGIVISVSDGNLSDSLASFDLTVTTNRRPTISGTPATSVDDGVAYNFTPTGMDADVGDMLTYSISQIFAGGLNDWATFDTSTGALTGTPARVHRGFNYSGIIITVTDSGGLSASLAPFDLAVAVSNLAPTITGTPAPSVTLGNTYNFPPTGMDGDGDPLTYSITNQPDWANFDPSTGALTNKPNRPNSGDVGDHEGIVISVTDGNITTPVALPAFDIEVTAPAPPNTPPTISGTPATSVVQGGTYSFTPGGGDVDTGDTLTYSITNKPDWANFDTSTGALTSIAGSPGTPSMPADPMPGDTIIPGTPGVDARPGNADVGVYPNIVIGVSDGVVQTPITLPAFSITVTNVNDAPTISGRFVADVLRAREGEPYRFTPTGEDVDDGDTLTYSITNPPDWTNFDPRTGALTGTPSVDDIGRYEDIVITVTDAAGASASLRSFDIVVVNVNDAPTISGVPETSVDQHSLYTFTPTGMDPDSEHLRYSIENQPPWAEFSTITGVLTGTPTDQQHVGIHKNIVIGVSDGVVQTPITLPAFSITVTNVNDAPTIGGLLATALVAREGEPYSVTPTGADVDDGDTLAYSISNQPDWANFDLNTGALTNKDNRPSVADIGRYEDVVITVTDAAGASASLRSFDIVVVNVNDAPTITGTPETSVAQHSLYTFTPTGMDPDSEHLRYSIENKPPWAEFSTLTGVLTGTPTDQQHVGVHRNIVITLSDVPRPSGLSDSLPAFDIEVRDINDRPTLVLDRPRTVPQGQRLTITATGADVDPGDTAILTYRILNAPSWATFSTITRDGRPIGVLTGTPGFDEVGEYENITIFVSDGLLQTGRFFTLTVTLTNTPPTISGTPRTRTVVNRAYSFTPTGFDTDDDILEYAITNKPSWADFNAATGALTGTPTSGHTGDHEDIVITVTDGHITTPVALAAFDIVVTLNNEPPTTSGLTATTAEDTAYTFAVGNFPFNDVDSVLEAVRIDTLPASANGSLALNGTAVTATQVIPVAGIPNLVYTPVANANGEATFTFSVSDGDNFSATATATVTVTAVEDAPIADAGADQTVAEGASVTLNGSGSFDPEGENLAYVWTQSSGIPTVTLSGETTAAPTFTAPENLSANAVLEFSLVVNDGGRDSLANTVTVTIVPPETETTSVTTGDAQPRTITVATHDTSDTSDGQAIQTLTVTRFTVMATIDLAKDLANVDLQRSTGALEVDLLEDAVVSIEVNETACSTDNPCQVTLSYTDQDLDDLGGITLNELTIFHYVDSEQTWEELEVVDRDTQTITALTSSFSPFALGTVIRDPNVGFADLNETILPEVARALADQTVGGIIRRIDQVRNGANRTVNFAGQSSLAGVATAHGQGMSDGSVDMKTMLGNSGFALPLNAGDGTGGTSGASGGSSLTFWGGADYRDFDGSGGGIDFDGDLFSVQLGVDGKPRDDLLLGLAASWSESEVDYRGGTTLRGEHQLEITSVHPYASWETSSGLDLWVTVGYGEGDLEITDEDQGRASSEVELRSLGVGGNYQLRGSSTFRLKGSAVLSELEVKASDDIDALEVDASLLRIALERSSKHILPGGASVEPSWEFGARYDGDSSDADDDSDDSDDGETGLGAELGAGIRYADPAIGLTLEGNARTLVGRKDYNEWGISGRILLQPGRNGRGLSFSMSPVYGSVDSGIQALWSNDLNDDPNPTARDLGMRMETRLGYGLSAPGGHGLLTPYAELTSGASTRRYRLGMSWELGSLFDLNLVGERSESSASNESTDAEHIILLKGVIRL